MTNITPVKTILSAHGLRPTKQRLLAGEILFDGVNKHMTAEALHREILETGKDHISLATIYNTLATFTGVGLLRSVTLDSGSVYYDTNITDHHHIYDVNTRELSDLNAADVTISGLPDMPDGKTLDRIDLIFRVK